MSSYFDSEEEIAFGPITLEEIKFDLKRPRPRLIKNHKGRHTTVSKSIDSKLINKETGSGEEAMSSGGTESTSKNDSKAPDSSVYFTAAETSAISQNTDNPYLSAENTFCFVKAALNMKNNFNLEEEIPEALVENTVLSPDNRIGEKLDKSSPSNTSGSSYCKVSSSSNEDDGDCELSESLHSMEDEIIMISSDDESFEQINVGNNPSSFDNNGSLLSKPKEENLSQIYDGVSQEKYSFRESSDIKADPTISISSDSESDEEIEENVKENMHESYLLDVEDIESGSSLNGDSEVGKNILSVIPEETRSIDELTETRKIQTLESMNEFYQQNGSFISEGNVTNEHEVVGTENNMDDSSPSFTVPEIDLAQFDESCQLNDTIELMDRMLRQAAEQDQEESAGTKMDQEDKENNRVENWSLRKNDIISASFMQQPTDSLQDNTKSKTCSGVSPLGSHKSRIPTLRRNSQEDFKVPLATPVRHKVPSALKQPSNFKNVASPIGLYIKYSPQPYLKKNITQRECSNISNPTSTKTHAKKTADKEIPFVKYKPAKKQVCTSESKLFCPPYIQKMIKDPLVTKHEKKIVRHEASCVTEQRLQDETDLTRVSINDSCLNDTHQDVSILKEKTALRR